MGKKILSFDLTGTLAKFSFCDSIYFQGLPKLYSQKHGMSFEEARDYLKTQYDEVGDHEADWYDITYWFRRFDLGNGWYELMEDLSCNIRFYFESHSVLEDLSNHYELVLTTNACREFVDVETASIKQYFSKIISCVSDFKEVKKTPEFYGKICQLLDSNPNDIIHIGDHWEYDFLAPREYGLTAYYLDREGKETGEFIIHNLNELKDKLI